MGQSLCPGCHGPCWDGAGPQGAPGFPPAPVWGLWEHTGALHQAEKRGDVSARRKLGRPQSCCRGSPRRCQHLLPALPANKGLPSQLPARGCDRTCSVLHPDLLTSHSAHLGAPPCRSSSSLGSLCFYHHCPPRLYQPPQGSGYHNLPAPPRQWAPQPSSTITNTW